jgi:carbonic anhydrase
MSYVDNPDLNPLLSGLRQIGSNSSDQTLKFNVLDIVPKLITDYYHYDGSLTTPTCTEGINWYVSDYKLKISKQQLNDFKSLKDPENHRVSIIYLNLLVQYKLFFFS